MSDDSQHPRINQITEFATRPDDATVEGIEASFAAFADPFRVEMLHKMENWIAEDDGTSMKKKAQLWNLQRRCNALHQRLRKVGR